jgi:ATP-dependent DNA helicase RecQ
MSVTQKLSRMKATMQDVFGITELRTGQEEVIRAITAGQHTLALMPTGAGKSLCYQLPALHLRGTTVIVSPLIALMKDQVDKLGEAGLDAAQLNSALSAAEQRASQTKIEGAASEFIFTTPERFTDPAFLDTLRESVIDFVVIDEAHCISQWGHDFRPAYLALGGALKTLGCPPVLALTATATDEVIQDIQRQLELPDMRVINTGIYRANLNLEVIRTVNDFEKQQALARLLKEIAGTGLIYAATIKTVEELYDFLVKAGFAVARYHGRLSASERKQNQERFMADELKAVVATNAFGMGIDKPDIRFVIHYQMPGSLEAYYQEAGRAGRDDQAARCILFYDTRDRRVQSFFLGGRYPSFDDLLTVHTALAQLHADAAPVAAPQLEAALPELAKTKLRAALALMKEMEVVREHEGAQFELRRPDLTSAELAALTEEFTARSEQDRERLEQMMRYGQSAACRWRLLREYFGEAVSANCGHCDNCLHPLAEQIEKPATTDAAHVVPPVEPLAALAHHTPSFAKGMRVTLPKRGAGRVVAVEGDKITVAFPNGESGKFKSEFVTPLERNGR